MNFPAPVYRVGARKWFWMSVAAEFFVEVTSGKSTDD